MISGHLRFSFFLAAVLLYSDARKKKKFRHILDSLTACRKLLFRHAETSGILPPDVHFLIIEFI